MMGTRDSFSISRRMGSASPGSTWVNSETKFWKRPRGNPGQIVEMCRSATEPLYVSGRHIKFAPLRIDALIRFPG